MADIRLKFVAISVALGLLACTSAAGSTSGASGSSSSSVGSTGPAFGATSGTTDATSGGTGFSGSGSSASSGTTGASGGGPGVLKLLLDAGTDRFAGVSLTFGGHGEAELFYAQSIDGGYSFLLQHLTPAGAAIAPVVRVSAGLPIAPPKVSVASDGIEIACCWEDFGIDVNPYTDADSGSSSVPLVLCNSVPVGGSETDDTMDGGYNDDGADPHVAAITGSASDVVYVQPINGAVQELLYQPDGYGNIVGPEFINDSAIVPLPNGFAVLMEGGGLIYFYEQGADLSGPPFSYADIISGSTDAGAFAVASNGEVVGVAFLRDGAVRGTIARIDGGSAAPASGPNELPIGPVAAASCPNGFGFAYAVDGGGIFLRAMNLDGTMQGAASTRVASLGVAPSELVLVPSDGGLLMAVGTSQQIAVYQVACP